MTTVTLTSQQETSWQLQLVAGSCGLRRSFLEKDITAVAHRPVSATWNIDSIVGTRDAANTETPVDIEWYPSYQTYRKRVERLRSAGGTRRKDLPAGFPSEIR